MKLSVQILLGCLWLCCPLHAAQPDAAAAPAMPSVEPGLGGVETATRQYLNRLSSEKRARSDAYFEGGYWLQLWEFVCGAGIAVLLLETRLSAHARDLANRWTRFRPLQVGAYWMLFLSATSLLALPLTWYSGYLREHQYGLSNQSLGSWFLDALKSFGVDAVFGGLVLVALFGLVRRLPRTWHLWGSAVLVGFVAVGALIAPVFIAPLFNRYTPLPEGPIRDAVLRLARANGVPATQVWQSDASRQTTRISANVSGFLGTERITLNDNLLNRCSPAEIEAVMAHELGHYVLNHNYRLVLFFGLVLAGGLALLRGSLQSLLAWRGHRWNVHQLSDPAVLPLAVLVLTTYLFLITPLTNTMIRVAEQEADLFGLNAARQPDGFAEAALKLADYRKLEPSPLEEWLFYDHPSGRTRIRTAMQWKAEQAARGK